MTARAFPCAVCGDVLLAQSDTTEDPQAPELVRFEAKPWIGIVLDSVDDLLFDKARLIIICSNNCKNTFFRNGG